jgi:phosphate transport system substrate-binding protein
VNTFPTRSPIRTFGAVVAGALVLAGLGAAASASTVPPDGPGSAAPAGSVAEAGPAAPFELEPVSGNLTGSGATFPAAFYGEALAELQAINPDLTIEYGGGGSGKGRTDLAEGLVSFAGTDSPVKEEDLANFSGEFVYVPTVIAPITVSYNLEGVDALNLTPAIIAGIFQLTITNWNDAAIAADNPDAELPDEEIVVVRRADSSGTTDNFTRFLDAAVGEGGDGTWTLGSGSEVEWPEGTQAGDGNGGVAQIIGDTPGAIGYVDLSDAVESSFTFANVQNANGEFVAPTLEATTIAASAVELAEDGTFFTGWSPAPGAYPIAAQTWIIAYVDQPDAETAAALQYFLTYLVSADGQALAEELSYAPLPDNIRAAAEANIAAIGA